MACVTKKKGKWAVDFYDQHGKRRLKVLKAGSTKKQAKELLREIESQIEKGIFIPTKHIPKFSTVAEDWLKYKKPNLRASTWGVCEGHTRNHFKDLNDTPINRITIATVEKFITDRQKEGTHILTLRKVLVTLNQILAYAVRHRYIDYNPLRDAERPRGKGKSQQTRNIRILNPVEINSLLDSVSDAKYKTLIMLAIFSGARQGELFGLKWTDIDWTNNQIHIQRTFNNQEWYDVKTDTSDRRIDIGPAMMKELKKWRLACPPNKLNLVFPNDAGGPIDNHNFLRRIYYPATEKAKLKKITFHSLRHTYASLLIEQGENIKYIQTQLGHSSPTVTLNVYAHLMKPVNQESAIRLENTILKPSGDQMETGKEKNGKAVIQKGL